jgi:hypothetical protein
MVQYSRRLFAAMDALNGDDNPPDSCVWFIVGPEMSVREWSALSGWSGRLVSQPFAGMILIAALVILASRFDFQPSSRAA